MIAEAYVKAYKESSVDEMECFAKLYPNNIISMHRMNAIYLRLSDSTYFIVKDDIYKLADTEFLTKAMLENGDNYYLMKVFGNGYKGYRNIIRELAKKAKTITGHNRNLKFCILKGD